MSHFAVIAPPLPGHWNPLLVLASALVARGHRVTFVHIPDAAALVRGEGIGFAGVGAATHPPGWLEGWVTRSAALNGFAGLPGMIADVAGLTDMICREAPAALDRIGADAVLADQMEPGGGLVAEAMGLPFLTTATGLPLNSEPAVPPPYVGWRWLGGELGKGRNLGGHRVTDLLMNGVGRVLARHCLRFGLPVRRRTEDFFSPAGQLAQAVRSLDFPRERLPDSFHYLGPFRPAEEPAFDWPDDGRPIAFCSLGSLQGSRAEIFRLFAQACVDTGLRPLIAHGGRLDPAAAASLPGDPLVYDHVPQRAVLAKARVAITHAGFNTVLDSLSFGVPLVAIPLAFEQPATAARLSYRGVAEIVPRARLSAERLKRAVETVLGDPGYRLRAATIGADIATAGGVSRAADLAETLVRDTAPAPPAGATTADAGGDDARDDSRNESR